MESVKTAILSDREKLKKATFSAPQTGAEFTRVVLRPVVMKGASWQLERFSGTKVFHLNLTDEGLSEWLVGVGTGYGQIVLIEEGATLAFTKKGNGYKLTKSGNAVVKRTTGGNDREKNYLLKEGENIPAFVDLGVFTADYKVKADKTDKFRQINRFVEFVDDALGSETKDELVLVDFGCGKSYLTFFVYYYLTVMKGKKARIIGYDLKADVVARCNEIAKKYGYTGLEFYVNDVTKGGLYEGDVDGVLSLHACDVATDYALEYALKKNAKYIFSVPCCQHEINGSVQKGGDFDLLLRHGLIKERFSALLTDAVRAEIVKEWGYKVDVLEFVDFAHSPKNIMLRCKKTGTGGHDLKNVEDLMQKYGFTQRLYDLVK